MKKSQKILLAVNLLIVSAILVLNYFYQSNGFDFTLKCVCSGLFFFSDLMLVFDWFIGLWSWTDHACMGTYYPALCLLAFAMYLKNNKNEQE